MTRRRRDEVDEKRESHATARSKHFTSYTCLSKRMKLIFIISYAPLFSLGKVQVQVVCEEVIINGGAERGGEEDSEGGGGCVLVIGGAVHLGRADTEKTQRHVFRERKQGKEHFSQQQQQQR